MQLTTQRKLFSEFSTIGDFLVNGERFCHTLEPHKNRQFGKPYSIDPGTYEVKIFWSNDWRRKMPHVLDVPDFEGILIHPGNYPHDTRGCTMLGIYDGQRDFIGHSIDTFDKFWDLLVKEEAGNKKTFLTIVEVAA